MTFFITPVPTWLSISFSICLITFPVFLIANTVQKAYEAINIAKAKRLKWKIFSFYWGYFLLVAISSILGCFLENVLPPKILIATALPLFLFYLMIVRRFTWFKKVIKNIRLDQLIHIHVFRFVGVFFFGLYAYDVLPRQFAFIGGVGDIVSAVFVFPVIYVLKKKRRNAIKWAFAWNVFGMLDILSVMVTAIIITRNTIACGSDQGVVALGVFPFSWIPAFAPATIVFLHILIFEKIKRDEIEKQ